jgi:glycosyltransferase involved in cell wall biosynthesis
MRILQIHKHHHFLGGAEKYYLDLSNLLDKNGHKVANFSMKSTNNIASPWEKFFVKNISFQDIKPVDVPRIFARMLFSVEAKNKLGNLLDEFKADIAHIHNIYYHISPSILHELKKRKIPVVYSVHDYHLLTPNITFFHKGKICEITTNRNYYKAIFHKCVADSFFASVPSSLSLTLHDIFGIYRKNVDIFIAPSKFMKKKLTENGFNSGKISHLPYFVDSKDYKAKDSTRSYVLYLGRLYEHKGVQTLIETAHNLPNIKFKIAGDGPQEQKLKNLVNSKGLLNIDFLGRVEKERLKRIISEAAFCITPSLWYENMPYSILESLSAGKPVIASKIGGIPEIVKDKQNGLLFKPGNSEELAEKIIRLWKETHLVETMGRNAIETIQKNYNPEDHYKKLLALYKMAIKNYKQADKTTT